MNTKTDRWEIYTDKTGKRHWRWPATAALADRDGRDVDGDARPRSGWTSPQQAFAPVPARGK